MSTPRKKHHDPLANVYQMVRDGLYRHLDKRGTLGQHKLYRDKMRQLRLRRGKV